jgi:hypothetical protein
MQHPFVQFLIDRDLVSPAAAQQLLGRGCLVREPIGMIALSHGLLQATQIDAILDWQRNCSERFGEIAVSLGFLTAAQVDLLVKIQEFRAACAITEALALSDVLGYEDSVRYLGAFLAGDAEVVAMMATK